MTDRAPLTLAVAYPSAIARPLTGRVELALGEALSPALSRPDRVSGVLAAVFERIGGASVTTEMLERLTSGARAWLLAKAAQVFLPGAHWFQASCTACGQEYDLSLSLADLPRAPKGDAFPVIDVATSLGERRFEVPNGRVERALTNSEPDQALRTLAAETGLSTEADTEAAAFSDRDLTAIEAGLDAASPDISEEIVTVCPTCDAQTKARIDPLDFAFPNPAQVLRDVHDIAKGYGWLEPDILALPSIRRRSYANLIRAEMRR